MSKTNMNFLSAFVLSISFLASTAIAQSVAKNSNDVLKQAIFAQHCFWTGEMIFGGVDGVKNTEAGFYDGREVTRVWYDPEQVSLEELKKSGERAGVADRLYIPKMPDNSEKLRVDALFDERLYRRAPERDQKKQLQGTPLQNVTMSEYQRTKANAFVRKDFNKAKSFLER